MKRILTEAEAFEIIKNEEAESLPFQVLNETGQVAVAQFVNSVAANPERHALDYWYSQAERVAGDRTLGEAIIIEMSGSDTTSRHPETLTLEEGHFDWVIND